MKKITILCAALALLATVSSCKKDQETVTLGAVIDQNAKVYVDDHLPSWENGDQMVINDDTYAITAATGGNGQINNVTAARAYRAIYPASLVAPGIDLDASPSVPVTLPATQAYALVGNHQRCELPMGAYLTSGNTLLFHNLCSVVRVTVNNQTNDALDVTSITIAADNAILSGEGTATIAGQADDAIVMSATGGHEVTLVKSDNTAMETLSAGNGTAVFDIVVPAFATADNVTITVNTTDGYQEFVKSNVTLANSTVTTVTANVNQLTPYSNAYLVDGPTFNAALPTFYTTATAFRFEYNNTTVTSGTLLSTAYSPYPIYGNLASDGTWVVSTAASTIYANADCSGMFGYRSYLTTIDFGSGFNTSRVTNMASMFDGCIGLTSLDVSNFNTSNVTNMSRMFYYCSGLTSLYVSNFNTSRVTDMNSMFYACTGLTSLEVSSFNTSNVTNMCFMFLGCEGLPSLDLSNFNTSSVKRMYGMFMGCSGLTSLDLSNFNTSSVTNMWCMFDGCSGLSSLNLYNFDMSNTTDRSFMCSGLATTSGACTITCPTAVRTALESGTDLPTSGVTFTWMTH